LKENSTLRHLKSAYNRFASRAGWYLGEALKVNTSLVSLHLGNNYLGDFGTQWLAQGLAVNTSLTSLTLYRNHMVRDGSFWLAHALKSNATLTELDLSDNDLTCETCWHMADALRKNTSLTSLNLRGNDVQGSSVKELVTAIRLHNYTIKDLRVTPVLHCDLSPLEGLLERNRAGIVVVAVHFRYEGNDIVVDILKAVDGSLLDSGRFDPGFEFEWFGECVQKIIGFDGFCVDIVLPDGTLYRNREHTLGLRLRDLVPRTDFFCVCFF
jgi:hypothetical protein